MIENIKLSSKRFTTTKGLVLCGLFTALYVVLGMLKIYITPDNRISFTFAALAMAGYFLGPVGGFLTGGIGDLLNYMLLPTGGAFFPGYTLSAALSGLIYGLFFYRRSKKQLIWAIPAAKILVVIFINLLMNTYWTSIFSPNGFYIILMGKLIKTAVIFPIQLVLLYVLLLSFEKMGIRHKYLEN